MPVNCVENFFALFPTLTDINVNIGLLIVY